MQETQFELNLGCNNQGPLDMIFQTESTIESLTD